MGLSGDYTLPSVTLVESSVGQPVSPNRAWLVPWEDTNSCINRMTPRIRPPLRRRTTFDEPLRRHLPPRRVRSKAARTRARGSSHGRDGPPPHDRGAAEAEATSDSGIHTAQVYSSLCAAVIAAGPVRSFLLGPQTLIVACVRPELVLRSDTSTDKEASAPPT